jgi:hypothetical protein
MKKLSVFLLVILFVPNFSFAQIGAKAQQNKIHGIWQNNSFGYQMTLMLNADGSGEFDGDAIKYSTQGSNLSITIVQQNQTNVYTYTLQGNSLSVSGGDLDQAVTFIRNGSSSVPVAANTVQPHQSNTGSASDKNLIGVWSGNSETIEFTTNGQCNYLGQTYPYQLANGQITLQTAQGNFMMAYVISGNQLSLTVNGQTINYSKGANATPGSSVPPSSGGRRVAQELVGKWCYVNVNSTNSGGSSTEQCITLNADGSYEYYGESSRSVNTNSYAGGTNSQSSDRGTWTYDGSRIYYTSSSGAGSGSYVVEKRNHPKNNDPMIVLDGTTYVTFYQKSPW